MISRQTNTLGQMRIDAPHIRAMESSVAADFDVLAGQMLAGKQALALKGFNLITTGAIGAPATSLQVRVADALVMHYGASEAGTLHWVPSDRADETLTSTNTRVTGSFTASQTNYVGIDLSRSADDSTADNVQFLDASTLQETAKTVPLARTMDYRFVISTSDFSSQPTILPIAKIVTDASNNVSSIEDARNMMFRLADGGDFPSRFSSYSWPGTRYENTSGDVFSGGDKAIDSMKSWMDAVMSRLWEVGGGEYWYSTTADRNVNMVWMGTTFSNGENFEWSGTHLHWKGLRFIYDNSSGYANDVADQTGDSSGLTNLAPGECLYVDLDRTKTRAASWVLSTVYAVGDLVVNGSNAYECTVGGTSAGSGGPTGTGSAIVDNTVTWKYVSAGGAKLVAAKGSLINLGSPTVPGSRQVIAWRIGANIFTRGWRYAVGTTFVPATTSSLGVVRLNQTPGSAPQPVVVSIMANGQAEIVATASNSHAFKGTGHGTGIGLWGVGGAGGGKGVRGDGTANFEGGHFTSVTGWAVLAVAGTNATGAVRAEGNGTGAGIDARSGTTDGAFGGIFTSLATNGGGVKATATGTGNAFESTAGDAQVPAANKFKYAATRARSMHVPASAFQPVQGLGGQGFQTGRSQLVNNYYASAWACIPSVIGSVATLSLKAEIHLPHGAAITAVKPLSRVDHADWAGSPHGLTSGRFAPWRRTYAAGTVTMTKIGTGSIGSSGNGGASNVEFSTAVSHTVDNSGSATYELEVILNAGMTDAPASTGYSRSDGVGVAPLRDGRILVAGGWDGAAALDTCEIYDPLTGEVTSVDTLNRVRRGGKLHTLDNGNVIIFGGADTAGSAVTTCEMYDPEANTWTDLSGSLTNALNPQWIPTPNGNGVIVVAGSAAGEVRKTYIVNSGGVFARADTNADRAGCVLVWYRSSAANGVAKLAAIGGGATYGSSTSNTWESYDYDTDAWTTGTGTMTTSRQLANAVTLHDGRVLVHGGGAATAEIGVVSGATSLTFSTVTAPALEHVAGFMYLLPDGTAVSMHGAGGAASVIQTFNMEGGVNGTWRRWDAGGTLKVHRGSVASNAGQTALLPSNEIVTSGDTDTDMRHVNILPGGVQVRAGWRIPSLKLYGIQIDYTYTEVNVEM